MATKGYNLEQTGEQVQAALNRIINLSTATEETDGLMSSSDKSSLENLNTEINNKVDKVSGKGLSTNDFTNEEKAKVDSAYQAPSSGIPKADLSSEVQASLTNADNAVRGLSEVNAKIPAQATSQNQLADKAFVNSSVATASADFKGTYDTLQELQAVTADKNDYGYVVSTDSAGNTIYSRYKYTGSAWVFEYDLNNSSFTASEWAAIQSGITSDGVQKLNALPTNSELNTALAGKQATLVSGTNIKTVGGQSLVGSGNVPMNDPDAVKYTAQTPTDAQKTQARTNIGAYAKPSGGIPKTDLASGVQGSLDLADSAIQARPSGEVDPTITPAEYATQEELAQLEAKMLVFQTVDTSSYNVTKTINSSGQVASGLGVEMPVTPGQVYKLTGRDNTSYYAVLSAAMPSSGSVSFATGFNSRVELTVGSVVTIVIPDNGAYLYVLRQQSLGKCLPLVQMGVDAFVAIDARETTIETNLDATDAKVENNPFKDFYSGELNLGPITKNEYIKKDGTVESYNNWSRTDYINIGLFNKITITSTYASEYNVFYDVNKTALGWFKTANGDKVISIPAAAVYMRLSSLTANFPSKIYVSGYKSSGGVAPYTDKGVMGVSYPDEVSVVENQLTAKLSNRFHFIHISDNHGKSFGYAQEYLDHSPAKFIVNTGDLVQDKFADKDLASFVTIDLATEPTKPVYLCLGNHDYARATSKADVFNAFISPTNTHNGTTFDKSYYSIDFTTEGVKCIFLDPNEGWSDSDYANFSPSPELVRGNMSQTQINWFAGELQDAIDNSLHAIVFTHLTPGQVDRDERIHAFSDSLTVERSTNLGFLRDIVKAFIDGDSVSFTYNGNTYNFTFATAGHFVSWCVGHQHGDLCGWMEDYPDQFVCVVCRPYADSSQYGGSYDGDKLGVHWNYCTIDTEIKSFCVYRMGQQTTIFGTDRVSFRILYK